MTRLIRLPLLATALLMLSPISATAESSSATPGLLPEIKMEGTNVEEDDKKALETELMISRSEKMAIQKLQQIIVRRRGQHDEPHLLYRLAELYMRRAKTGRFFEVFQGAKVMQLAPPEAKNESSKTHINSAIRIYNALQERFPKYNQIDEIYFHNAFAHQQVSRNNVAKALYHELLQKFPKSRMVPESHLALGEMYYESQDFKTAWTHFSEVQKRPDTRFYSFALYKGAWTLYNMQRSDEAIASLEKLIKLSGDVAVKQLHNLRTEALRDLVVFYADYRDVKLAFRYFSDLANEDELAKSIGNLASLYQSHSRESDAVYLLKEFDKARPMDPERPKLGLHLVELSESLKKRDEAIAQIKALKEICSPKSAWSKAQPEGAVNTVCSEELNHTTRQLAAKWWELWKKNAHATQFADWSEQAFALYLDSKNPKDEAKIRYSYAELLFQRAKYHDASAEYEKAALLEKEDQETAEKASYAALVSLEKAVSDKWDATSEKRLTKLSVHLLTAFPKSQHAEQVQFKQGFVAYELGRMGDAKKHLKPLVETAQDQDLRVKAEDLYLDVLNVEKDYLGLRTWAAKAAGSTKDTKRKSRLEEISREARMAELEIIAATDPMAAAQAYESFYRENKEKDMGKSALVNAVRLNHESKAFLPAARLALEFAKEYPKDEKATTMLQEAARLFEDTARPLEAAQTLELLSTHSTGANKSKWQEIAADYYSLEGQEARAISLYKELAANTSGAAQAKLLSKIFHLASDGSPEKSNAQKKLVALQVEPYWSELLLKDTRETLARKNYPEAFAMARRLVGQAKDPDIRAEARLIQADILKTELIAQSVRTSLDRLELVLSIKTEKLEKAQSAYIAASRISNAAHIQTKALQGLADIYRAYVTDIIEMPTPRGLASEEDQILRSELSALTGPIEKTLKDTEAELVNLKSKVVTASTGGNNLVNYASSQSLAPLVYQVQSSLEVYVPYTGGNL